MNKINFEDMDISIAYSIINMKLRDYYSSLEDFCANEEQDLKKLVEYFGNNGYYYDIEKNKFNIK
ncbi:DUF4250 domain-containing protein [Fusobacterium sp. PH5-44]|uniref:DUF4250 domain-containing protein n=1 Tax=unclassified Fusobacterium TaxID=2648384 RepID=UPI003D237325